MKQKCKLILVLILAAANPLAAAPTIRKAQGANNAAIGSTVMQFFADMGGSNNGVGNSYTTGRRDLNFDSVADSYSEPNTFPGSYFKDIVPKGAQMHSTCLGSWPAVSADSSNPTGTPVRFGNIHSGYPAIFATFNSQKLLAMKSVSTSFGVCSALRITFSIPGTNIPATVSGFGVVFSDVDSGSDIRLYDSAGRVLTPRIGASSLNYGLSFIGVTFSTGERIASVEVLPGHYAALAPGGTDGNTPATDRTAIAAVFYGEPRAATFHSGDFDGDGSSDYAIFRGATGNWFMLQSGSNTIATDQWGMAGDVPVDGDFDGDSRADFCVFRPSTGEWLIKRSSNGGTIGATFGQMGDKAVAGDYDKDGRSDIAVWRPSAGTYYVLTSSSNFTNFFSYPFGQSDDVPVQGAAQ